MEGEIKQTHRHTHTQTLWLLDQLGTEGRVGEHSKFGNGPSSKPNMFFNSLGGQRGDHQHEGAGVRHEGHGHEPHRGGATGSHQ